MGRGPGPYDLPPGRREVVVNGQALMVMIVPGKTKVLEVELVLSSTAMGLEPIPGADGLELSLEPVPGVVSVPGLELEPVPGSNYNGSTEVAAVPPDEAAMVPPTAASQPAGFDTLTYVGLGTAAAGLVAFGVGTVMGAQSASLHDDADNAPNQVDAGQLQREANDKASSANLFLLAGGLLAAAGATLTIDRRHR